jgi:adenine-specific DNA-methyltransferase
MVKWLLGSDSLQTVLEPAFGLGVFSRHLLSHKPHINIRGYEIDDVIIGQGKRLFIDNLQLTLVNQDYMLNGWSEKYDGIICNPPYFKFQDYDNHTIVPLVAKQLQCNISGFTNLYALFLLKSLHQLRPKGRCAYIVPSEFLNSDYGKLIKSHLLQTK